MSTNTLAFIVGTHLLGMWHLNLVIEASVAVEHQQIHTDSHAGLNAGSLQQSEMCDTQNMNKYIFITQPLFICRLHPPLSHELLSPTPILTIQVLIFQPLRAPTPLNLTHPHYLTAIDPHLLWACTARERESLYWIIFKGIYKYEMRWLGVCEYVSTTKRRTVWMGGWLVVCPLHMFWVGDNCL